MSVHERRYQPWTGALTREATRFLVLPRYALGKIFSSRLFLVAFIASFVWPVICAGLIYLRQNASALAILELTVTDLDRIFAIDANFFYNLLTVQARAAFLIVFLVGPGLVSADYRNNALPLYLARPFSRVDYVLGKLTILGFLLALVVLVPPLLLFVFQAFLADASWRAGAAGIAPGLVAGALVVIVVLSLLTLAISATVKWKPVASAALLACTFVPMALGQTFNAMFDTWWGDLLNLVAVLLSAIAGLLDQHRDVDVPLAHAWVTLALLCAVSLWLLWRKVRAYEVVS
jgi:ABC-2 type transport system permease protein